MTVNEACDDSDIVSDLACRGALLKSITNKTFSDVCLDKVQKKISFLVHKVDSLWSKNNATLFRFLLINCV